MIFPFEVMCSGIIFVLTNPDHHPPTSASIQKCQSDDSNIHEVTTRENYQFSKDESKTTNIFVLVNQTNLKIYDDALVDNVIKILFESRHS